MITGGTWTGACYCLRHAERANCIGGVERETQKEGRFDLPTSAAQKRIVSATQAAINPSCRAMVR